VVLYHSKKDAEDAENEFTRVFQKGQKYLITKKPTKRRASPEDGFGASYSWRFWGCS